MLETAAIRRGLLSLARCWKWKSPMIAADPTSARATRILGRSIPRLLAIALALHLSALSLSADDGVDPALKQDPRWQRGEAIYQAQCVSCHGELGAGVADRHPFPLIGDETIGELTRRITATMPEEDPDACVGEDALAVSTYIHSTFYSEAARIRRRPPRVELSRLTAGQLRQSLSDLYAHFAGVPHVSNERGVKGIYFDGGQWKDENKKLDRIDAVLDFDWGSGSPCEEIKPEEFYVHWRGGLKVDVTGEYELIVRSTCSFVMDFGRDGRELIDNHVQSGDQTEFRRTVMLTAGRVYPFKIDFRQRERKTERPPARFSFAWIPPGGIESIVPTNQLVPGWLPPAFSLQTQLPPDDRTYGYERGISVSREWDDATTSAALEFAQATIDELWPAYRQQRKDDPDENRAKLRNFLAEFVAVAFGQTLSDEERARYVDASVDASPEDETAIRRAVLLTLKNPRFLYRLADTELSVSQRAANRLATTLFDSIPADSWLLEQVAQDGLVEESQVRSAAQRMVDDHRVRAKTREFLHAWLNLPHQGTIAKSAEEFPGFDEALVADLRRSLDAFLDEVAWGEQRDYRRLFVSDWAYTTERMAAFYGEAWEGIEEVQPGLWRTAAAPELRHGVLTHPLLMSSLAYIDSTSPIHRGVFLNRFVLGRALKTPNEAFTPLSPSLHPDLTTRERVELQTAGDNCQSCHARINALGFTLENFDAVGRFRQEERGKPINAQGSYVTLADEEVRIVGVQDLATFLASSPDAHRAFVTRAFQHFVKQPPAAFGSETLDQLTQSFIASGYDIRTLLVEIAVVAANRAPAPLNSES